MLERAWLPFDAVRRRPSAVVDVELNEETGARKRCCERWIASDNFNNANTCGGVSGHAGICLLPN
jgi:hypothetical protein